VYNVPSIKEAFAKQKFAFIHRQAQFRAAHSHPQYASTLFGCDPQLL